MLALKTPDIDSDPDIIKKRDPETSMNKNTCVVPQLTKSSQNAVPKSFQIRKKSKLRPQGIPSDAPKRPWVARWTPKMPR